MSNQHSDSGEVAVAQVVLLRVVDHVLLALSVEVLVLYIALSLSDGLSVRFSHAGEDEECADRCGSGDDLWDDGGNVCCRASPSPGGIGS
jgi:hypothetical protein